MVFMNGILPDNEYTEVESRAYLNPQLQIDETSTFIDNLRQAQQANNAEIAAQTRALGTEVPSNLGGLVGGEGYFTSRYQTPQFNSLAQSLRTSARASALNQALENDLAIWKNRQQQAYRNYQKRAYDRSNSGNPGTTQNPYSVASGDDPNYETTTPSGSEETWVNGLAGYYTLVDPAGNLIISDMNTGDSEIIQPGAPSRTKASASPILGGGEIRTLPNGNKVWVKPGYGLTKDGGKYYLVNQDTGVRTEVGGY